MRCLNCESEISGAYCQACGQRTDTAPISWKLLWKEILSGILYFDRGFFYTSKELLLRPGVSIRSFIQGKRVRHFKPFAYVFVTSTIYGLLANYLGFGTILGEFAEGFYESAKGPDMEGTQKMGEVLLWLKDHYAWASLIMLPQLAIGSYLAFRNSGYSLLENAVISAYYTGVKSMLYLVCMPLGWYLMQSERADILHNILLLTNLIVFSRTYYFVFHQYAIVPRIFRIIGTLILYVLILLIFTIVVAFSLGLVNSLSHYLS